MADLTGHSLGRYHILEQLGEGGMATVYKAYDTRLEADVAVKVIRTERLAPDVLERSLKRFEREAKALAKLTHLNIVKVTDYGEYEGKPYLVMPYLPGGTLKQRLGNPMQWQEAIRLLLPIARALDFAHSQKMIHRDVKPSNILMTLSGDPMLTDFGIAKILDLEDTQDLTGTGAAVGTPEYMAPEQTHAKTVDHRVDIYALGVVLYEMLTGRKPYVADTPMAVLIMQARDPLPSPRSFVPNLPVPVERILLKALAKRPGERYATMGEMAGVMEALLSGAVAAEQEGEGQVGTSRRKETQPEREKAERWRVQGKGAMEQEEEPTLNAPLVQGHQGQPTAPTKEPGFRGYWAVGAAGILVIVALSIARIAALTRDSDRMTATQAPLVMEEPLATGIPTGMPAMTSTPTQGFGDDEIVDGKEVTMRLVPAGEFTMGSNDGDDDEKPIHTVYLDAYWMDKTEVTNAMFSKFVEETGYVTEAERDGNSWVAENGEWNEIDGADWSHPRGPGSSISGLGDHPVVHVSWNDAVAYCEWRGARLPTEAEWEKAASWDDEMKVKRVYPWGDTFLGSLVNFCGANCQFSYADKSVDDEYGYTSPVGHYPGGASYYGLLDMSGNVWEWVWDWYKAYPGNTESKSSYGEKYRVLRGGSWGDNNYYLRSAIRYYLTPDNTFNLIGFRCTRSH